MSSKKKQEYEKKVEEDYVRLCNFIMNKRGMKEGEKKMRIQVSGYIEMSVENFNVLMEHKDPHMSLVYSIHMGYVDATNLEFQPIEE